MATFSSFEEITAWQRAREVTRRIYEVSSDGVFGRDFALRDQIRRASISVMSNIAEGFERDGAKEFAHFLSIAKGSSGEVRAQLYVALDQGYIEEHDFRALSDQLQTIGRMLGSLMAYLRTTEKRGHKFKR